MISKHVDIIAVAALILMFAFAERFRDYVHLKIAHAHTFNVPSVRHLVIVPPRVPVLPHLPRLPRA